MREDNYDTLYRSLYQNNRDAIITFNRAVIVDANKAALDLFEVIQEEFIGKEIYDFSVDPDRTRARVQLRDNGIAELYSTAVKTKRGIKEVEVTSIPVNVGDITSYGIIRDITDRLRTVRRYRDIFEQSADLILVTNEEGVVFINPSGLEYLGLSNEDEIIGKSTLNFIHPDYQNLAADHAAQRRAGGDPPSQYRLKMVRKDGKGLDVEFNASYIDWEGVPSSLTIVRDISWQVQAEKDLRENERRISGFLESATDGYSILDSEMRYLMVNDTELKYTGMNREDYIGKHILEVFPDLEGTDRYKGYKRVLKTGEPIEYNRALVLPERNLIMNFSAFKAGDLLGILARDITEQVTYQTRLEALHKHAQQVSAFESREQVAKGTMDIIHDLLGFEIGAFGFVEEGKLVFTEFREESTIYEMALDSPGITVRAINTGETQLVRDTRLDPDYRSGRVSPEVESLSELDVPIKVNDKVVALINLEDNFIDAFNEDDKTLVETLGAYVASVIARIDYEDRLNALHEFALTINKFESIDSIARETIDTIHRVFDFPFVTFGIIKDDSIWFPYETRLMPEPGYNLPLSGEGVCVQAVLSGETQVVEDITENPHYIDADLMDPKTGEKPLLQSEVAVPVFLHDQVFGVINIETTEKQQFSTETVRLLELVGEHVSSRLTSLRLESERFRAEQAEEMQRIKTRFVSTATHELRTPLTSIKGYLELSKSEMDINKVHSYIEVAYRNSERLEALTKDLLDQQRIEESRLEIDKLPVNLNALVGFVIEEVKGLIDAKDQKIEVSLPDDVQILRGDEMRLGQVFINLLDNASKYSPVGSSIEIRVEKQDTQVLVSIKDQGSGISKEDIGKLFTPFPDIERAIVSERSVGLGLSICKGIIELHNGEIWAESEGQEKGTTFYFTVPLSE